MELENQVTSLEPSKKLEKLGVKQESLFYWDEDELVAKTALGFTTFGCEGPGGESNWYDLEEATDELFSAFTVAELGEILYKAHIDDFKKAYLVVMDLSEESMIDVQMAHNLMVQPDISAGMLIYLLENKLLTLKGE